MTEDRVYEIAVPDYPKEFEIACACAQEHVRKLGMESIRFLGGMYSGTLTEHFSFALGNQIFFVFVTVDGLVGFEGVARDMFLRNCAEAKATACVMEMRAGKAGYSPAGLGWGLEDPQTGRAIDPPSRISEELIEMSDWDVHDFAVQVVVTTLERQGHEIAARQSNPLIDPSIWFDDDGIRSWVMVRGVRHPAPHMPTPSDAKLFAATVKDEAVRGYFCSIRVANANDNFDPSGANALPLYRGHALAVGFGGLEPV